MTDRDLLADLNEVQQEAVTHVDGPLLILAGPGSGKTRVITRRVAHLLRGGVHPANILAITFTNKAAGEMRQRIDALVPGHGVWISTFHSMGARLLRMYADRLGLDRNFTIYDQSERLRVVKTALEDAQINALKVTPESLMHAISKAKNGLISPGAYSARARDFFEKVVDRVYPIYEKRLRDNNAMDFDDLIYWPALVLQNNAEIRQELDDRFRYVLIDEYQDTNQAQYRIARLLTVTHPNLCVVGDPDQSIYKFRGSDISNILNFERDFPSARVLTLNLNYRSTRSILAAAGRVISHNLQRKAKELITENPHGDKVKVVVYPTGVDEADGIARHVAAAVHAGRRRYRDHAVLVRVNALTRGLEQALVRHRVPFQIVRGLAFFDRKENRDVIAYLRLLVNPRDDMSFERIINEPSRGIGQVTLAHLKGYAETNQLSLLAACGEAERITGVRGKTTVALKEFYKTIVGLQELLRAQPDELIKQVLDRTGYRRMLEESGDEEDQQRLANVEELITAARQFGEQDNAATVAEFLENITLASDIDNFNEAQDAVSIMTMHAAKGLEFPVVYLAAVEQGILPHQRAVDSERRDEVEEERRLLFVAMTRAKEELYLSHARFKREFRGQENYPVPSQFLNELPPEAVETVDSAGQPIATAADRYRSGGGPHARDGWAAAGVDTAIPLPVPPKERSDEPYIVGMLVRHQTYGVGKVIELTGFGATRTVKVRFPTQGVVPFRVAQAKLQVIARQ
ncbi:MAG: UvrD-helicase domain-containing protein [Gemmataceae bacterium]